jgi:hypothetical protein
MVQYLDIGNITVWVEREQHKVLVTPHMVDLPPSNAQEVWGRPEQHGMPGHWIDPIGAAYTQWREMTDRERITLMLETAIDLAMDGFDLGEVVAEFAKVRQFRSQASDPMRRALAAAQARQA